MVNCSEETPIKVQPSLSAHSKCSCLSVKMFTIIECHKQNRHFIGKSIGTGSWLLKSKALLCGLC